MSIGRRSLTAALVLAVVVLVLAVPVRTSANLSVDHGSPAGRFGRLDFDLHAIDLGRVGAVGECHVDLGSVSADLRRGGSEVDPSPDTVADGILFVAGSMMKLSVPTPGKVTRYGAPGSPGRTRVGVHGVVSGSVVLHAGGGVFGPSCASTGAAIQAAPTATAIAP